MANVLDVAQYILERKGFMTAMKLQKLVYYSQAWSLAWDERPLFAEPIQAWANGPVVPALYSEHRGRFDIMPDDLRGADSRRLSDEDRETIDAVLKTYGDMTGAQLSDLTHREMPWKSARRGLSPGERSSNEIPQAAMLEFYSSLIGSDLQ
jgi:uncharacterized phage-associated protein